MNVIGCGMAADEYQSYMRGWKNGACVNAMDPTFTTRDAADLMRIEYEAGYTAGRAARNVAAIMATARTGYEPSVLRLANEGSG
jgi:hypothetical protein